ncbi:MULTISPECIES: helix-turn-helix domain-containing protein [Streptomyces]|uniref:helix-turn-helix domain-containing protein n=1 Tax=Streptomyces TaxID=1883 RepID=UPI0029B377B8|nr:helix-turn-helix domain-containing protein [Streptomyces sp. AK02-04a]MDX3757244.1 helix-turn-helix domain-containing protein [Streptomyces sp. AK02-04a]
MLAGATVTEVAASLGVSRQTVSGWKSRYGHSDPGLTLRVYAHLMPSSQERTRKAIASTYEKSNALAD